LNEIIHIILISFKNYTPHFFPRETNVNNMNNLAKRQKLYIHAGLFFGNQDK